MTRELLRTVRPHPHSARSSRTSGARALSSTAGIDAAEEQEGPRDAEREQRPIAQNQLLRRLPAAQSRSRLLPQKPPPRRPPAPPAPISAAWRGSHNRKGIIDSAYQTG